MSARDAGNPFSINNDREKGETDRETETELKWWKMEPLWLFPYLIYEFCVGKRGKSLVIINILWIRQKVMIWSNNLIVGKNADLKKFPEGSSSNVLKLELWMLYLVPCNCSWFSLIMQTAWLLSNENNVTASPHIRQMRVAGMSGSPWFHGSLFAVVLVALQCLLCSLHFSSFSQFRFRK